MNIGVAVIFIIGLVFGICAREAVDILEDK